MPREATTLNTWAMAIAKALDARGCDSARLFAEAGLDHSVLHDPNGRYPVSKMSRLWKLAVQASNDPCIGLKAAAYVQPATFHGLGFAVLASQTLYDALQRTARYSRIVSNAADVYVEETPEGVKEIIRFREDVPPVDEAIDLFMASTLKLAKLLTGADLRPLRISLRREAPGGAATAEYQAFFGGCPVDFGGDENSILIPRELLMQPLPMANPALARQNDQVVVEYLARFDGARISEKVRAELITRLPSGEPSRAEVAGTLHFSEKTLQRRLKEEGSSYQQILEETRRELAQQYLREDRISVCEITFRLGFSDQSSFTRAFKRWTGSAPGEYREQFA
jgi:AraC-like DNA-binding protein